MSQVHGLYEVGDAVQKQVVEYDPDSGLRDTEQIPLQEEGGIEGFMRRDVLPCAEDAWYVSRSVKIGYEISFDPMRTLEDIPAEMLADDQDTAVLLKTIVRRL